MDPVSLTLALSFTLTSGLIIALCIPLVRGRVKPNSLYGIRLPQAFKSEDAWHAINRFGGKCFIAWCLPMFLIGVACFFIPLQHNKALTIALAFVPLICVIAPGIQAWLFARRYAAGAS